MDEAGYEALFGPGGARDPHLGTRLVSTRRPGMELVVAAHKSVAVLGLLGRAEDMHAILDAESDVNGHTQCRHCPTTLSKTEAG